MSAADARAQTLVGLLADEGRLKVVSALVLGAATVADISRRTGIAEADVRRALDRLVRGGLVEHGPDGRLRVAHEEFAASARRSARTRRSREVTPEALGASPEQAAVLRNFMTEGRLSGIPASSRKRRVVLDFLAGRFEPGVRYPEREVNDTLAAFHPDVAALRRYLVDEGFLERSQGVYWRSGGSVEVG